MQDEQEIRRLMQTGMEVDNMPPRARRAVSRADAEDITQDVMLRVFGKLGSFEGRSTFKTWLVRVTRNASKDWLKKKAISRQYAETLANEPQEQSRIEFEENRLIELLKELSPVDREILTLRFVAD